MKYLSVMFAWINGLKLKTLKTNASLLKELKHN